jgi:hypothetical protein
MPERKWTVSRRRIHIALVCTTGSCTFVLFQNFTAIPNSRLSPHLISAEAREDSAREGSVDIRDLAPSRPSGMDTSLIATPQAGNDLGSVSQDWMTRQAHLLTGGADEKILADFNKSVSNMMKTDTADGTDTSGRGPASKQDDDSWGIQPTSMKLTALNRVEFGLANEVKIACTYQGSSVRVDLSKAISKSMDINLQHDTNQNTSSMHLKYNW